MLDFGASGPGLSPDWGHCVVFLGNTLNSHGTCLHSGVQIGTGNLMLGLTLQWTSILSRESTNIPSCFLCKKLG